MLCCCITALPHISLRSILQSVPSLRSLAPSAGNIQSDFLNKNNLAEMISPPSIEVFRVAKRPQTGKGKGTLLTSVTAGRNPPREPLSASAISWGDGGGRGGRRLAGCPGGVAAVPLRPRAERRSWERRAAGGGRRQRRAGERCEGGQPSRRR